MAWKWAALMPHPPILVPRVGGGREREAAATTEGVTALVHAIRALGPTDAILLLSPHQLYVNGALAINRARILRGSFAPFGAPQVSFEFVSDEGEIDALSSYLMWQPFPFRLCDSDDLTHDQGSTVPLYFLRRALGVLPPILFTNPVGLEPVFAFDLGKKLASWGDADKERSWGLLASGDLSHCLKPGAPAGYNPAGRVFDDTVVAALRANDASALLDMPALTRKEAGECGLRSVLVMLGLVSAADGRKDAIDVLSYEGPFGVGYCNALWRGKE